MVLENRVGPQCIRIEKRNCNIKMILHREFFQCVHDDGGWDWGWGWGATLVYADDNRWSNCTTTNCSSSRPIRIETRSENWNARRRVTWFWNRKSHTRRPIGNNGCQWRIYTLEMRSRKRQMQMRFSPLNSVSAMYNDLGKYLNLYYKKTFACTYVVRVVWNIFEFLWRCNEIRLSRSYWWINKLKIDLKHQFKRIFSKEEKKKRITSIGDGPVGYWSLLM